MAGIIVADTIQSGGSFIRLNSASQTVATINASGIYANTGNLLIASNGTIGVASITNTAITGTITQAQIGTGVAGTGPSFSAYRNGTQAISSAVWTKVQFDAEDWDSASCYDSSTNYRFTPNVAGYYQITARFSLQSGTPTRQIWVIRKNGSSHRVLGDISLSSGTFADGFIGGSAMCYMNGTSDYVEMFIYLAGGGTVNLGTDLTYFQGFLARAT